ncbi:hypothetical protein K1719_013484 [Acacia pycnantha]|nr:hypothetical protein K1719_013484 [Acacia pycnantha]
MPPQKVQTGHEDTVHDVAMDFYGKRTALTSSDHTIKIVGVSNTASQHLATLTGHQGTVWQVFAWLVDRLMVTSQFSFARADGGGTLQESTKPVTAGVTSVSWAPSTALVFVVGTDLLDHCLKLCSGGYDNLVKVWKLDNGVWKMDRSPALEMHTRSLSEMLLGHQIWGFLNLQLLVHLKMVKSLYGVAKEGDQWAGKVLHDFKTPVWRVSWSLTGITLAVADENNNLTLWKEAVDGEWQQVTTVET